MTALKPLDQRNVRGAAAVRYDLNRTCAMPTCDNPVDSAHHAFPRSLIGNGSWFVLVGAERYGEATPISKDAIPHVTGLCGSGTTGHHGDVEHHRAWIRLEDGVWNWYDRDGEDWKLVGPLNPQPGAKEGKPKRKKFKGEAKRVRTTISYKVPKDERENGAEIIDDLLEQAREKLGEPDKPAYYLYVMALYLLVTSGG